MYLVEQKKVLVENSVCACGEHAGPGVCTLIHIVCAVHEMIAVGVEIVCACTYVCVCVKCVLELNVHIQISSVSVFPMSDPTCAGRRGFLHDLSARWCETKGG